MKLYGYQSKDGKIEQAEVEVEEKVVLVPKGQSSFPFIYEKQLDRDDIGNITGYYPTIFLKSPDFKHAKEKFLVQAENKLADKEKVLEDYRDSVESAKQELKALKQETNELSQDSEESEAGS